MRGCKILNSYSDYPSKSKLYDDIKHIVEYEFDAIPSKLLEQISNHFDQNYFITDEDVAEYIFNLFTSDEAIDIIGDWFSANYNYTRWTKLGVQIRNNIFKELAQKERETNDVFKKFEEVVVKSETPLINMFQWVEDNGLDFQKDIIHLFKGLQKNYPKLFEDLKLQFNVIESNESKINPNWVTQGIYVYDQNPNFIILNYELNFLLDSINNKKTYNRIVLTFTHELIHHMTSKLLKYEEFYDKKYSKKLHELFEEAKSVFGSNSFYGLTNIHEFVAEAFSNTDFRDALSRLDTSGRTPFIYKLANEILNFLRSFFENTTWFKNLESTFKIPNFLDVLQDEFYTIVDKNLELGDEYMHTLLKKNFNLEGDFHNNLEPKFSEKNIYSILSITKNIQPSDNINQDLLEKYKQDGTITNSCKI